MSKSFASEDLALRTDAGDLCGGGEKAQISWRLVPSTLSAAHARTPWVSVHSFCATIVFAFPPFFLGSLLSACFLPALASLLFQNVHSHPFPRSLRSRCQVDEALG